MGEKKSSREESSDKVVKLHCFSHMSHPRFGGKHDLGAPSYKCCRFTNFRKSYQCVNHMAYGYNSKVKKNDTRWFKKRNLYTTM